jgi:glycosyltransferase involved in cell wall biosynthesis
VAQVSRTVRIATRLFSPEVGAAAFRQRVLADSFAALGHPVEVLTTRPPRSIVAGSGALDDGDLRVSRWPVLRDATGNVRGYIHYLTFDIPLLVRLLSRRPPALLVAEPPPTTGLVVRLVAAIQRRPYVYYAADVWSDGAASTGAPRLVVAVLRKLEASVMRNAVLVLSVSEGVTDRVVGLGVPPEQVLLVGNGVDTTVFAPDGPRAGAEAPYFVYAGTMSEWQGADVFVEALARVRAHHRDARIVFMGQGSELAALKDLAHRLVPGGVEFRGVVAPAEVATWMRGAAAGLVSIKPGLGYDFAKPTKIYAATGCGTPVIFAGPGAGQALVADNNLGWTPGYEVEALAEAMREAIRAPVAEEQARRLSAWTEEHASLSSAGRSAAVAALRAAGILGHSGSPGTSTGSTSAETSPG